MRGADRAKTEAYTEHQFSTPKNWTRPNSRADLRVGFRTWRAMARRRNDALIAVLLHLVAGGCGTRPCRPPVPLQVAGRAPLPTQITLGRSHGCARMNDGTVECWGTAGELGYAAEQCGGWGSDAFGQLGRGTDGHCEGVSVGDDPVPCAGPGVVKGVSDAVQVVVSDASFPSRTCALSRSGTVECWGEATFRAAETDEALADPPLHRVVFSPSTSAAAPRAAPDGRSCRFDGGYSDTPRRAVPIERCRTNQPAWTREQFYLLAGKHVGERVRFAAPLTYSPCEDPYYCAGATELWLGRRYELPRYRTRVAFEPRSRDDHMPAARGHVVIAEGRLERAHDERDVGFVLKDYTLCERRGE